MPPELWPSFARAIALSLLALGLHHLLLPGLARASSVGGRWRWVFWLGLVLPFLSPPLLTAYAYAKPFMHLVRHPWLEEMCYSALLFLRIYPLALLAGHLMTRRLSPEALHCHALAGRDRKQSWYFRWKHLEPVTLVSALLVFLYAFHDFEMASLLQRPAWTVAIFDAQAQGYQLGATWGRLWILALLQIAVITFLLRQVGRADARSGLSGDGSDTRAWLVRAYVFLAAWVVTLLPVLIVSKDAVKGLGELASAFSLHREVGHSLVVAFVASTLGYLGAQRLSGLKSWMVLSVCLLPGLLGTLLLSLSLLGMIQWAPLTGLREQPVPLVAGLVLGLLPVLTLLSALARRRDRSEASWTARLSGRRSLRWRYASGPHFGIWACGFYLAYFEVTTSAILAPASMTPVMVRLYNLMHYGQDTMLSAYVLVVVLVPFVILMLAFALGYGLTSRRA